MRPSSKSGRRAARLLRSLAIVAGAFVPLLLSGCSDNYEYIDTGYSAQLIQLKEGWPGVLADSSLSKAEKEVYEEYGAPDMIRILFDRHGAVARRDRAMRKAKDMEKAGEELSTLNRGWLYSTRDLEVRFIGPTAERHPITPKVRTLLEYGDPHNVAQIQGDKEKWSYFDAGRVFTFEGDELVLTEIQPTTNFTRF